MEKTPQLIDAANIDIISVDENSIVFRSTKQFSTNVKDVINAVKLKSGIDGVTDVTVYAYRVQ